MKRLLWIITMLFVWMSCNAFADTIIELVPNDGSGDNFVALQRNGADFINMRGGTPPFYYDYSGYSPGTTLGGPTALYIDSAMAQIGGHGYELQVINGPGVLDLSSFTFPTNDQSFQVPVSIDFSVDMLIVETGDPITVSGFASGHMAFTYSEFDGLYYPAGGFATPEPGTLGLLGTGLLSILALARARLRI